jgi:hypothetical protein
MLINLSVVPLIDEEFDEYGFDAFDLPPRATDEEEATYQRWVDIDLKRHIEEGERLSAKFAKHSAHVQASLDKFYITNGGK